MKSSFTTYSSPKFIFWKMCISLEYMITCSWRKRCPNTFSPILQSMGSSFQFSLPPSARSTLLRFGISPRTSRIPARQKRNDSSKYFRSSEQWTVQNETDLRLSMGFPADWKPEPSTPPAESFWHSVTNTQLHRIHCFQLLRDELTFFFYFPEILDFFNSFNDGCGLTSRTVPLLLRLFFVIAYRRVSRVGQFKGWDCVGRLLQDEHSPFF